LLKDISKVGNPCGPVTRETAAPLVGDDTAPWTYWDKLPRPIIPPRTSKAGRRAAYNCKSFFTSVRYQTKRLLCGLNDCYDLKYCSRYEQMLAFTK
jgi:hypothetical protein